MRRTCLNWPMDRRRNPFVALSLLAVLAVFSGCTRPTYDLPKLRAIKAEAALLAASHPIKLPQDGVIIPKDQWPPAIASLKPEFVIVEPWGVDITIKPYFDGGWGYEIPRNKRYLPMPATCYSEPGPGVFWHGPC